MNRKRILVPGVSSDAGAGMTRQLAESGYEVIGADWRRLPFGLRSRYLRTVYPLPEPSNAEFSRSLINLVRTVRPDAFLPLGTTTVACACREAALLKDVTTVTIPGHDAYTAACDKTFCTRECRELGIPCPTVYSPDEAARALAGDRSGITLVVKPGTDAGMARGVSYVTDAATLQQSISSCLRRFDSVTIQEYIPGDASHMHTAVLLFDRHSTLIAAFTTQKLRQWPATGGVTALSRSTDEYHLVEQILPFFNKWHWKGAAEVEFKFDARDGNYKVIEINPRFPAYLRFALTCGLPLARLTAALTLEEEKVTPLTYPSYTVGMKFVNPGLFLRTAIADTRTAVAGDSPMRRAIRDLAGSGPAFAEMLTDPMPFVGRLLHDIRKLFRVSTLPSL